MNKNDLFIIYSEFIKPKIQVDKIDMRLLSNINCGERLTIGYGFSISYFSLNENHQIVKELYKDTKVPKSGSETDRFILNYLDGKFHQRVSHELAICMDNITNLFNRYAFHNSRIIMEEVVDLFPEIRDLIVTDLIIDGDGTYGNKCRFKNENDMVQLLNAYSIAINHQDFISTIYDLLNDVISYIQCLSHQSMTDEASKSYIDFLSQHKGGTRNRLYSSPYGLSYIIGDLNDEKGNIDVYWVQNPKY